MRCGKGLFTFFCDCISPFSLLRCVYALLRDSSTRSIETDDDAIWQKMIFNKQHIAWCCAVMWLLWTPMCSGVVRDISLLVKPIWIDWIDLPPICYRYLVTAPFAWTWTHTSDCDATIKSNWWRPLENIIDWYLFSIAMVAMTMFSSDSGAIVNWFSFLNIWRVLEQILDDIHVRHGDILYEWFNIYWFRSSLKDHER